MSASNSGDWEVVPIRSSWLWRMLAVRSPDGEDFDVVYNGWGIGSESVSVNGVAVSRVYHWCFIVAPRISFELGGHRAAVNIRVSRMGITRKFELEVDEQVIFRE